jgi:hypothetical protein
MKFRKSRLSAIFQCKKVYKLWGEIQGEILENFSDLNYYFLYMIQRRWTDQQLCDSVKNSTSIRQVLSRLCLTESGGNYAQIKTRIAKLGIDASHITGQAWNKGLKFRPKKTAPLKELLVNNSEYQSYKLKLRLFQEGIKLAQCEECGWNRRSKDGRLPLELHHVNGNRRDNRIENLQILCPNCHSLKSWYRGRNRRASGGIGRRSTLKKL